MDDGLRIWEKHKPYIEILSQVNNSCVFFVELLSAKYYFISPNFKDFYGYDPYNYNREEPQEQRLEQLIHPDDVLVLENIQKRLFKYLYSLPESDQTNYKHIFEFRVLQNNQKYVKVISQQQILEKSPNGSVFLLGVTDISPDQTPESNVRFRLVNIKTGNIIPFSVYEDSKKNLTKREIEILKLVDEGMLSKEISEKLSISIHTVNGHRQNILEKMKVDNAIEAVKYARNLGLLE